MLSHLRVGLLSLLVTLQSAQILSAQNSGDEVGIREAISRQLEAMKRGDGAEAFAVASPVIQSIFQDAPTFMAMAEKGYTQVLHSSRHRFLKLENVGGTLIERVLIDSDGGSVVAQYEMVQIDGAWRINGCTLEAREDA